jgi:2-haloacid dehalogenase
MSDGANDLQAVVWDVGGVLLDWDPRHLYRTLFTDEEAMERFLAEICTAEWHADHDRGVSVEASVTELAAHHPEHAPLIRAWAERGEEMIAGPIGGSVEILRELIEAGVPCYALTNMEAETYPGRRARYDFMRWFRGTMVSAHEGVIKPDPVIFRRLIERFSLVPERTVMIDDSQANVAAATQAGLVSVRFESPAQLRGWLVEAGLLGHR